MLNATPLPTLDPEIFSAISAEFARQQSHLELIASENFTNPAVMQAQGSVLTNKYAEGYPARRWYGGCEHVDKVEVIAIERAKNSSAPNTPTSSPTPAPKPMPPSTPLSSSPATNSSA